MAELGLEQAPWNSCRVFALCDLIGWVPDSLKGAEGSQGKGPGLFQLHSTQRGSGAGSLTPRQLLPE